MRLSKYSAIAALLVVLFAVPASGAVIYTEDFNYVAATGLVGQGGWANYNALGTNPQTIATSGLSYPSYPGSGVGLAVGPTATSGEDNYHSFTSQSSGGVYISFLVNVTSTQLTGDYFFNVFAGPPASNVLLGRVFAKKDPASTNFAFGIQYGSAGVVYTAYSYAPATTYLIVVKYTFVAGAFNDQVALFVDPALGGAEPGATLTHINPSTTAADATSLDAIAIRQGSSTAAASVTVDAFRVSTAWIDVSLPVSLMNFSID